MEDYLKFLETKQKSIVQSGFDVELSDLNDKLFPFQKFCLQRALKAGKYAFFQDCGLGKSFQQLEWAHQVNRHTDKPVLILAPLAVSGQTIKEGAKFGIKVIKYDGSNAPIQISNYEQLDNIDCSLFAGIVLDESSILKNYSGAIKNHIIELFDRTPYKLACTGTPAPNDELEIGNHAEFLNIMTSQDMRAIYFTTDKDLIKGDKYRLKRYAEKDFYRWISSWAIMISKPSDLGFDDKGYILPGLKYLERKITTKRRENGLLFNSVSVSATDFNGELRTTMLDRLDKVADIIKERPDEDWIIWVKLLDEEKLLKKLLPDAVVITGSDSTETKENSILWFTKNECLCQHTKAGRKNTKQNTGLNIMPNEKKNLNLKQTSELQSEENQIPSLGKQESNTAKNTTLITKTNSKGDQKTNYCETKNEESTIKEMQSIGKDAKLKQRQNEKATSRRITDKDLKDCTDLLSTNTTQCSNGKTDSAQSVGQSHRLLKRSNDYTLTTATQLAESGDCYAATAITPSGSLTIASSCSNERLCTCGANKKGKIIISKTSIIGFGVNAQNCNNQIFASLDFSFESLYQSIRRSHRFGQTKTVNIYLITTDTMQNVIDSIQDKEAKFIKMQDEMRLAILANVQTEKKDTSRKTHTGKDYTLILGDCVEEVAKLEDNSIDYSFFSPPFGALYVFSNDPKDMSNVKNNAEFLHHFRFLVKELYRVIKPGRMVSIHMMQSTTLLGRDGFYSIKDFRGDLIRLFENEEIVALEKTIQVLAETKASPEVIKVLEDKRRELLESTYHFHFHAENMIRKDPKTAAIRTKNRQLMWGTTKKDSSIVRPGLADYILTFKKPGENAVPIQNNIPFDLWCKIAEPVWIDVSEGDTLDYRAARASDDERHITPTQLQPIEWCYNMWCNKGETVLSPFSGIASEGVVAVKTGRKYVGVELKASYWELSKSNLKTATESKKQLAAF